jgi:uncharacterized protein YraI
VRNLLCFTVVAALAAISTPAMSWEAADNGGRPRAFVNANGNLNLRAWPGPQSQLLAKIPQGTRVEADRCIHPEKVQDNWCHVRFGGYVGWVDAAFLQELSGGYAGPSSPIAAPPPPPAVVAPPPPVAAEPPPPATAGTAAAQQRLPVPPEFVGRWATVYIPLCAASGGCSAARAFLPLVTVIAASGDSWGEPDEGKHFPMTVYPDPQGRAGYYRVVESGAAASVPDVETIQRVYRYGAHVYRDAVDTHPPHLSDDETMEMSGLSREQLTAMHAAPQVNVSCRLQAGSNAVCE